MVVWPRAMPPRRAGRGCFPVTRADLSHPVGCGIAMTFMLGLCMMSFCVYGPLLLIRLYTA